MVPVAITVTAQRRPTISVYLRHWTSLHSAATAPVASTSGALNSKSAPPPAPTLPRLPRLQAWVGIGGSTTTSPTICSSPRPSPHPPHSAGCSPRRKARPAKSRRCDLQHPEHRPAGRRWHRVRAV